MATAPTSIKALKEKLLKITLDNYELRLRAAYNDTLLGELPHVLQFAELGDLKPLRELVKLAQDEDETPHSADTGRTT